MASFQQCQEHNYNRNLLPPMRDVFLEIQVNKLIHEFFFASPPEGLSPALCGHENESSERKTGGILPTIPTSGLRIRAQETLTLCECDPSSSKPERGSHEHEAHILQSTQLFVSTPAALQTDVDEDDALPQDIEKGQQAPPHYLQSGEVPNFFRNPSSARTFSPQSEVATVSLCRADSFSSSEKARFQTCAPCRENAELKPCSKKPPLPPKLPNLHVMRSNLTMDRCFSDVGPLPSSFRRAKSEKKKNLSQTAAVDTSAWALLITLCFAVIMLGQGIHSSETKQVALLHTDAPTEAQANV
ncbi:hypothetical protein KP509_33G028600 [Ceratopteris richardii]|nr:hypothetical protein KP509_33G028600 [Ceratopteris richardii]